MGHGIPYWLHTRRLHGQHCNVLAVCSVGVPDSRHSAADGGTLCIPSYPQTSLVSRALIIIIIIIIIHGLCCRRSSPRQQRHSHLNDILWRAIKRAHMPAVKEPISLMLDNNKRPDGTTLLPWTRGKPMAWDVTVPDTLCRVPHCQHSHYPRCSSPYIGTEDDRQVC